jgi:hypothetical protein
MTQLALELSTSQFVAMAYEVKVVAVQFFASTISVLTLVWRAVKLLNTVITELRSLLKHNYGASEYLRRKIRVHRYLARQKLNRWVPSKRPSLPLSRLTPRVRPRLQLSTCMAALLVFVRLIGVAGVFVTHDLSYWPRYGFIACAVCGFCLLNLRALRERSTSAVLTIKACWSATTARVTSLAQRPLLAASVSVHAPQFA